MKKNEKILNCVPKRERYSEDLKVRFEKASETPIIFNFDVETDINPGFVSFTTGFNNVPDYDSTFILSAKSALKLGQMLIESANEADERRLLDHESLASEGKLSYMILKGWVDHIRIRRDFTRSDDYPSPEFHVFTIKAYSKDGKEPIYAYKTIMNLHFTNVTDFKYWLNCFSVGGKVKIYFDNYDPEKEAAKEEEKSKNKALKCLDNLKITDDMLLPPLSKQINSKCKIPKTVGKLSSTSDFSKFKK